ncbi:Multicopper oxidase with three cupredoxin domains (includes cell division protein FtsP and spore coat protein CotA) [Vibrio xiamenensis]|uniref:Multicopper oxidase with three cupredoxin domains (Includes cell division protein FtsP and spore coat protein CotA) n=1 Tax=Vibrio xiamenensis TaxID=861298 RepID=A0A1G8D9Z8_9VIBR|nr:multicopper oxidase family protein [Vibrio xiamenensis]SDH54189.1 Multicopper oxidase with three cupredoxin domains (includes cell division protein FtsP and spore coat protein CotA) [Vibrio xiamenensis]
MNYSRRQFIQTSFALAALSALPACTMQRSRKSDGQLVYDLTAQPATAELVPGYTSQVLGFNGLIPAPTIRCRQGEKVTIRFTNRLSEPTTIHWHGLRIPIEMDGVPFLSQPPIQPGQTFVYEFTPPDAGTFWYHPHMNSVVQLGKGLVGLIVVEESDPVKFDQEKEIAIKHWHLDHHGAWKDLMIPRLSARMGTPGEWGTVNGQHNPTYSIHANGTTRLRIANVDNTLTYPIRIEGVEAWVIAIDGNPVKSPYKLAEHKIGPGMRLDISFVAPKAGESVYVRYMKGKFPFPLCEYQSQPSNFASSRSLPQLPLNPIPAPDIANAEQIDFVFEWQGAVTPADKSGKAQPSFWLMNKRAWEGMSADNIPEPLAKLRLGQSYIFNLKNVTQYHHPIHLHGHTFTVLELDGKPLENPFHTDTVLLGKNGSAKVAFVADNPGRWMYHCHVIEHLKTGLMGYIQVA